MTELRNMKHSATVEHVTPQTFGGTDDPENLVASCYSCNNNRGTDDAYTFAAVKSLSNDHSTSKLAKKIRKYVKRAKKFAEQNFVLEYGVTSFEEWFASLKLCDKGKELFLSEFKQGVN